MSHLAAVGVESSPQGALFVNCICPQLAGRVSSQEWQKAAVGRNNILGDGRFGARGLQGSRPEAAIDGCAKIEPKFTGASLGTATSKLFVCPDSTS